MAPAIWYEWSKDSRVFYLLEGDNIRIRIGARLSYWRPLRPTDDVNDVIRQLKFELERSE